MSTKNNIEQRLYALAHVRPDPEVDVLDGGKGAYVKVSCAVDTEDALEIVIGKAFRQLDVFLDGLEEVALGDKEEVADLDNSLFVDFEGNRFEVFFGDFHVYEKNDS